MHDNLSLSALCGGDAAYRRGALGINGAVAYILFRYALRCPRTEQIYMCAMFCLNVKLATVSRWQAKEEDDGEWESALNAGSRN